MIAAIEAKPEEPTVAIIDSNEHNSKLKIIYDKFKEELRKRQSEIESQQITPEQRYFLERLQLSFNLFNNNPFLQKKVDELYKVYSKEIPDYAKSQLRRMRKENLPDDVIVEVLQRLIETARILSFQEKEIESERMIIRTICSEGLV